MNKSEIDQQRRKKLRRYRVIKNATVLLLVASAGLATLGIAKNRDSRNSFYNSAEVIYEYVKADSTDAFGLKQNVLNTFENTNKNDKTPFQYSMRLNNQKYRDYFESLATSNPELKAHINNFYNRTEQKESTTLGITGSIGVLAGFGVKAMCDKKYDDILLQFTQDEEEKEC